MDKGLCGISVIQEAAGCHPARSVYHQKPSEDTVKLGVHVHGVLRSVIGVKH